MVAELIAQAIEIQICQQVVNSLGTHLSDELVRIIILKEVVVRIELLINDFEILIL